MRPMERALLKKMFEDKSGLEAADDGFSCEEEHLVSVYLDVRGGTSVLTEIVKVTMHDHYLEAEAKNRTVHCVIYEAIVGMAVSRPPKESGRTGF